MERSGRRTRRRAWLLVLGGLALFALAGMLLAGCGGNTTTTTAAGGTAGTPATETTTTGAAARSDLILASTTSTQDSGLFDVLIPTFEKAYPRYTVKVIAVGTGEALKLGEQKDADVLLVHAPQAEKEFVAKGFGTERRPVMYNDFIIVGPAADPAKIKGMTRAKDAFAAIARAQAPFVSRGDDSGTHKMEQAIWKAAGIAPAGAWYQSAGQGMGEVLQIAGEKQAYTLTDRGTYLSLKNGLDLQVLVEGDEALFNQYGVIPVTGARNAQGARDFADWITGPAGQAVIKDYGVEKYGQPLFVPNAQ
ncbi:MAG: substrate-binding domain-containing protein [Thermoleophilia bacterium]